MDLTKVKINNGFWKKRKDLNISSSFFAILNSFEKSEEIVFPLIIFTGGFSESVEPIRFIISSQLLSDLNNKFKSQGGLDAAAGRMDLFLEKLYTTFFCNN